MKTLYSVAALLLLSGAALAEPADPAYRYSGTHAGGPANALIPEGRPAPSTPVVKDPAYRYSGTHAGGPANALIPEGRPAPSTPVVKDPAYHYSGTHAGGPANDLNPNR
ncbi:hypothetical protein [uncultured Enterovirga sp.]|uniref:hypothetical protein n=1 Tax=uncultured Enterovirga sp. TaxID=2026352 RepID=UPI0035CC80E7